jgi:hypothetical protein
MTLRALKLEVFGSGLTAAGATPGAGGDSEEMRLNAYEAGYKSGWDDATAEREKSDQLIAADLERNLRDISFSYSEARTEVLNGFGGLIKSIVTSFLPAIAAEAVVPLVNAELEELLRNLGDQRCELLASPRTAAQLEWLISRHLEADLHIIPEPAFADGRVSLRFGGEEREVDLSGMVATMTAAIRDFTETDVFIEERQNA